MLRPPEMTTMDASTVYLTAFDAAIRGAVIALLALLNVSLLRDRPRLMVACSSLNHQRRFSEAKQKRRAARILCAGSCLATRAYSGPAKR